MCEEQKDSFVFYRTFWDTIQTLKQGGDSERELAYKLMEAIIQYGLNGEYDTSNIIVNGLMQQTIFAIDQAQERYDKSRENGAKGGRPKKGATADEIKELLATGKTRKEVAGILGISEKTISRRLKEAEELPTESQPKDGVLPGFVF